MGSAVVIGGFSFSFSRSSQWMDSVAVEVAEMVDQRLERRTERGALSLRRQVIGVDGDVVGDAEVSGLLAWELGRGGLVVTLASFCLRLRRGAERRLEGLRRRSGGGGRKGCKGAVTMVEQGGRGSGVRCVWCWWRNVRE